MLVVRVRERGQVTLPREVRAAAGIEVGQDLLIIPTGPGTFSVQVLPPREPILALLQEFAQPGPAPDLDAMREAAEQDLADEYLRDLDLRR